MAELKTTFAGLHLKNPIIVSSSGLTNSVEKNKKLEEAGAGAIVLKSIFEEQISMQANSMAGYGSPEADDYLGTYVRSHALNEHIQLIKGTKKVCTIPVIASINCYTDAEWVDYALTLEEAGADALEINILAIQTEKDYQYGSFEQKHIDILVDIKKKVHIPVIMKLGSNITNPVALINQLYANGADAVVLFNRPYQPDINIDRLTFSSGTIFSSPAELSNGLRWTAISSYKVPGIDYAISGGVHCGNGVIKSILTGASAVEICSVLYQYGDKEIEKMKTVLSEWMDSNGYENLGQFKGKVNAGVAGDANPFERTQFMKYYSSRED